MDVYFFLVKLMIIFFGYFVGFDGNFDFKEIGKDYFEFGVFYVVMCLFFVICGIFLVFIMFFMFKVVGCCIFIVVMGVCLIIFGGYFFFWIWMWLWIGGGLILGCYREWFVYLGMFYFV